VPLFVVEGQWGEAREIAASTLSASQAHDAWRRYPARFLAWLAREQGDLDLAWRIIREEFPEGPATSPGTTWFLPAIALQEVAARLAVDQGDLPTARNWLQARDRWLEWSGTVLGRAEGHLGWATWASAAGDLQFAQRHAMRARDAARSPRQPLALLRAHRLLGGISGSLGRRVEAAANLQAALELAEACGAPYERALTLLEMAATAGGRDGRALVADLLKQVTTICTPLDARPALARVAALSRQLTVSAPRYPDGISAREAEVLSLITTGSSNQEIAERLVLSVRTVERHINSLYRKIDARGRADAVAYAVRHGLFVTDVAERGPAP
jgi:ATP/maltotriose-dependent transcriptional regulator MalT